ncbi:MAG: sensor histidine kinase [Clostridia bacterium]
MIRKSLTGKLIVVFSAILIAVVFLNIIINAFLLSKVYRDTKINAMERLFEAIYTQYENNSDNWAVIDTVKDTLSSENLRVFIWDKDDNLIIDSLPLSSKSENDASKEPQTVISPTETNDFSPRFPNKNDRFKNFGRMEASVFYSDVDEERFISKNDKYEIFSMKNFSSNSEDENFFLRAYLPGDFRILIQMPIASLDEAAAISNELLLFVGVAMLFVGIVIVSITSRNIAKPVKELSEIALSMQNLDFSRKYTYHRADEIGSLGNSINALSDKLESTIQELYAKNEELRQDNELKSRIDVMRQEFIANASHELKTPVSLISGYAEGLRDNVASDEESRIMYADVIIEETERLNHIIHQMLDLMEIDGAEEILHGRKVSVSDLTEEAMESLSVFIKNKDIKLDFQFDDDSVAYGDSWQLYQAVTNYLSNAINHVDDKKIIRIRVENIGNRIRFRIFNSGANLSQEDMENIWERFYKVDKAHTREYGGTGLGLAIVKSIIQLHKGEYGVSNCPDGVEFYFILNKSDVDVSKDELNEEISQKENLDEN